MPQQVIFDFDDFQENENALNYLFQMRARFPNFKVNLFTIPMKCSEAFLKEVSRLDWLRLHVHGWEHTVLECMNWSQFQAEAYFRTALGWTNHDGNPVFAKVFKGPGWGLNQNTVNAVKSAGMILANNADPASNRGGVVVPPEVRQFFFNGNDITADHRAGDWLRIHGHIGPMDCDNEIKYLWHHLQGKVDNDAEFHFIDDAVNQMYG